MDATKSSKSTVFVLGVIALYWVVSISMVFINKHILSVNLGGSDLTIFITWFQSTSAVFCITSLRVWCGFKRNTTVSFPSLDLYSVLHSDVLTMALTFVCSLVFNNLMLKHIEVSFYQVARSFTLIFTVILSMVMLKKSVSMYSTAACAIVVLGFYLGVDQEDSSGTLSIWGVIYGILACFTTAVCGIYIRKAESVTEGNSLKIAYFNNVNSSLFLLPLVYSTGQLGSVLYSDSTPSFQFWIYLTISGVMSLSIGWVSTLQIKYTSPITHHVSSNAKSVTQTVIAVLYYGTYKSALWWCGNFLVMGGILFYAYTKYLEDAGKHKVELTISDPKHDMKNDENAP